MKAEELMIGDWVQTPQGPRTVKQNFGVDGIYTRLVPEYDEPEGFGEDEIAPISLTPEILEKNGFKFNGTNKWESHESGFDAFVVPVQPDNEWWDKYSTQIEVCTPKADLLIEAVEQIFVHQLQQFFRLCGIEKDIVI